MVTARESIWWKARWCGCVVFFFKSRRRHRRCLSDWSSDVCSSDLAGTNWANFLERRLSKQPAAKVEFQTVHPPEPARHELMIRTRLLHIGDVHYHGERAQ